MVARAVVVATVLNGVLIFRRPAGVSRVLIIVTFLVQVAITILTATVAVPLQNRLSEPGHPPAEITGLIDQLIFVHYFREFPGIAVAAVFLIMVIQALRFRRTSVS